MGLHLYVIVLHQLFLCYFLFYTFSSSFFSLIRMDDIQLCKEITQLRQELRKLVLIPGKTKFLIKVFLLLNELVSLIWTFYCSIIVSETLFHSKIVLLHVSCQLILIYFKKLFPLKIGNKNTIMRYFLPHGFIFTSCNRLVF